MPFTKIFGTADGAYSLATNWRPIDMTNPLWSWTASGSGTNEYYFRTAANGNPGFVAQPDSVFINGSSATEGTVGSLTAGQWDYGDNDTLGYSTVYVRLAAAPQDPDDRDPFYVKFYQTPRATEHVRFAADSASVNSATGLDQSGVAIGDFIVEEGYAGTIGSADLGHLIIDPDRFEFNGLSECWLNLHSAAITAQVLGTGGNSTGQRGLYLKGSAIALLNVIAGNVGVASFPGETSAVTIARLVSGSLVFGNGCTLGTYHQYEGESVIRCGTTVIITYGGKLTTTENGAHAAITQHGGEVIYNTSGTCTLYTWKGGDLDLQKSGVARTITTLNKHRGSGSIRRNKEAVTITTETPQDSYTEGLSP